MSKQEQHNTTLIASVLKPMDDHRLAEKWGLFFETKTNDSIHIFGRKAKNFIGLNAQFHTSLTKGTLLHRFIAIFKFFRLLTVLKPTTVIITSFELISPSFIYAVFHRKTSFYYDVAENYALNIKHQNIYKDLKQFLFYYFVKGNEKLSPLFVKHYFYTEKIYLKQLSFLTPSNATLIENRYSFPFEIKPETEKKAFTFLICGTISKAYGIEKGIHWFQHIQQLIPHAKLKIVGHLTDDFDLSVIKNNNITLETSTSPLHHKKILTAIKHADCLLLPYDWSKPFVGCTPTKIYEANALNTPIIIQKSVFLERFKFKNILQINTKNDLCKENISNLLAYRNELKLPFFNVYYDLLHTTIVEQKHALAS